MERNKTVLLQGGKPVPDYTGLVAEMTDRTEVKPVTFLNRNGCKLFGMLHTPPQSRKDVGIIILSPGIKNRVAPHRLYLKMTRRFCALGFRVFRFDPEGLGDSEGEICEGYTADLYRSIQLGRFTEDTICAIDWMEKECKVSKFILSGLCGGAITGLHAGAKDIRVDSIIGLGIPVILDGSKMDRMNYLTEKELTQTRNNYLKKIGDPKAWVRFLALKSDYRLILKSIYKSATKWKENKKGCGTREGDRIVKVPEGDNNNNTNRLFPNIFFKFVTSRKIFMIFSGADRLYWEFEEKFAKKYPKELEACCQRVDIDIIKNANHIFSFKEWQDEMLQKSCHWITKNMNKLAKHGLIKTMGTDI